MHSHLEPWQFQPGQKRHEQRDGHDAVIIGASPNGDQIVLSPQQAAIVAALEASLIYSGDHVFINAANIRRSHVAATLLNNIRLKENEYISYVNGDPRDIRPSNIVVASRKPVSETIRPTIRPTIPQKAHAFWDDLPS